MTIKNIVQFKINIQDEIFLLNIKTKTYWINLDQPGLICMPGHEIIITSQKINQDKL
jgi:hypothetical protein